MRSVLTRRSLMARASALGAWLLWPGTRARASLARRRLLERLPELARTDSAKTIGRAWLQTRPEEAFALQAWLDERMGTEWTPLRLDTCSREDFAEGRIIELDGWMLAETEVRLFALATQL